MSSSSSSTVVRGGYAVSYDGGPFTTGFVLFELTMIVLFLLAHLSIRKKRRSARGRYERLDTVVGARAEIGLEALGGLALGMAGYSTSAAGQAGVGGGLQPSMSSSNVFGNGSPALSGLVGGGSNVPPTVNGVGSPAPSGLIGVGGGGGGSVMSSPTIAPLGNNGSFAGGGVGVGGGGGFGASMRRTSSGGQHHVSILGGIGGGLGGSSYSNNQNLNMTAITIPPPLITNAASSPSPLHSGGSSANISRSPSVSPIPQ